MTSTEGPVGGQQIFALVISAASDPEPPLSFKAIHQLVLDSGATSELDPLDLLPVLIPLSDADASKLLDLVSQCGSAKEVVVATQEALEKIERGLSEEEDEVDVKDPVPRKSNIDQLLTAVSLYMAAIPRLKLRRKSAVDSILLPLRQLEKVLDAASSSAKAIEGKALLTATIQLLSATWKWATASKVSAEDEGSCKDLLSGILSSILVAHSRFIRSAVAQRTLEEEFPRLRLRSAIPSNWKEDDVIIADAQSLLESFGKSSNINLSSPPSHADIFWLAHRPPPPPASDTDLPKVVPCLTFCIQTGILVDETLAILLRLLCRAQRNSRTLSSDVSIPLYSIIPTLASGNIDPVIRHQAFRVLSLLVSCSDPQITYQNLLELCGNSQFPQMRVAAVGLVKEAILKALAKAPEAAKIDPFVGSTFMRGFGPVLFRSNPPDLLGKRDLALKEFKETSEPSRLTECLSLYYVVLQRDEKNRTGVRDKGMLKTLDSNLINPLKAHLQRWFSGEENSSVDDPHDITPIVSLQLSLERLENARDTLKLN